MLTFNINDKEFMTIKDDGETVIKRESLDVFKDQVKDEQIITKIIVE